MTYCTEDDFQKIKAKLVATGDLPSSGIVVAAASKAARIEASISKTLAAVAATPTPKQVTPAPAPKVLTAFQHTIARFKADYAAKTKAIATTPPTKTVKPTEPLKLAEQGKALRIL